MIDIPISVGVIYKLRVYKADTHELVRESGDTPNMILDVGLQHLNGVSPTANQSLTDVFVGTGSSPVDPTQVGLDQVVGYVQGHISSTGGRKLTAPKYLWGRKVYRFPQGRATGVLTEVGIGLVQSIGVPIQYTPFNRALILDSEGLPTSVPVLSDEYLEVTCEFRNYFPDTISGGFRLLDKQGGVISEHTFTGKPIFENDPTGYTLKRCNFNFTADDTLVSTAALPTGNTTKPTSTKGFSAATRYVAGEVQGSLVIGLDALNGVNIRSLFIPVCDVLADAYYCGYGIELSPPLTKNNTQTLTFNWSIKFDRYTGVLE